MYLLFYLIILGLPNDKVVMMMFRVLAPYRFSGRCQRFGETVSILSPEDGDSIFLRNVGNYLRVYYGAKTQNIIIFILTAVEILNLTSDKVPPHQNSVIYLQFI
jgi:hypothetical protein